MGYFIRRNGQKIQLTEEEINDITRQAKHEANTVTCRLLAQVWLEDSDILANASPSQISVFMEHALPCSEIERLTNLYESRESEQFSKLETWNAVLTEQLFQTDNPVMQFIKQCIQEKTSPETQLNILSSHTLNPRHEKDFQQLLTRLSMRRTIAIWKRYNLIRELI